METKKQRNKEVFVMNFILQRKMKKQRSKLLEMRRLAIVNVINVKEMVPFLVTAIGSGSGI